MNRTIKFRCWDKKKQQMMYNFPDCILCGELDKFARLFNTKEYIVMQFTGLYDREGKEIYESDLLKDTEGNIYEVKWIDDVAGFWFIKNNNEEFCTPSADRIFLVVCGNRYENPDLLTHIS